jgi:prolipoprotein diacylglyceryltransferase
VLQLVVTRRGFARERPALHIAAVAITRWRWVAQGGSPELVYDVALWGFPAGIVGGRLYYLATTPGSSFDHW